MARTNNTRLRERTINVLKSAGYTNRQIAEALNISASTVHGYTEKTLRGVLADGNYYNKLRQN